MKASRQNPADILVYAMAYIAVLGLGFMGISRIDLLLSEPFGSLMVFTRTISMIGLLAVFHLLMWLQHSRRRQPVHVRP
jgi:uncharacterized membrane protein YuzA (DUF378 family)